MSVPLDNLYHWVEGFVPAPAVIYLFYPHGSKNISDLVPLHKATFDNFAFDFQIVCHDQEPLDYNLYENIDPDQLTKKRFRQRLSYVSSYWEYLSSILVKRNVASPCYVNGALHDRVILLHSEQNSAEVEKYAQNNFVPVYYWSHAMIARDWYRFAKLDTRLCSAHSINKKFLVYCRDWGHRREYRLKFLELLVQNDLHHDCQANVSKYSGQQVHYYDHQFANSNFELQDPTVLNYFANNQTDSSESARYIPEDFNTTGISVVLETVFDDQRIHLTEKILRPIACGHPFILAAGPCSLALLKHYGFKTFNPWIDEAYDAETDSLVRIHMIQNSMKKITDLNPDQFAELMIQIKSIAKFNQEHFFSEEFQNIISQELSQNLRTAFENVGPRRGRVWRSIRRRMLKEMPPYREISRISARKKIQWIKSFKNR